MNFLFIWPLPSEERIRKKKGGGGGTAVPPWSCEPSVGLTAHAGSRHTPVLALMESFFLLLEEVGSCWSGCILLKCVIIWSDGMGVCVRSALGRGSDG